MMVPIPKVFLHATSSLLSWRTSPERNGLPVELNTPVTELARGQENGAYSLTTPRGTLRARNVMIASGSLNRPVRPPWAATLPRDLHQMDASDYRSAVDLQSGAVLVVGSGQSGGQIAEDLAEAGRTRLPRHQPGRTLAPTLPGP